MTVQRQSTVALPTVSVVIPMRNEEEHIFKCLQSVVEQDYPKDLMEVLVVDGMSGDKSGKIAREFARKYKFIRVMMNPKRSTASSLNSGIVESRGEVIVRMDAHCLFHQDYIHACIQVMGETGADNVGGYVVPLGTRYIQKAIALVMGSFFGIGSTRFSRGNRGMFVDTVSFGAYRRQVFEKIGLYDENATYGEDDELNLRLTQSGGRIFLSPRIISEYYPRSSISSLWKQYYNYGRGKVRTIKKHGRLGSWRHLIPGVFLLSIVTSLTLFLVNPMCLAGTAIICGSYLIFSIVVSARICRREGWKYLPVLPVVFGALHFSYGSGFLSGFLPGNCGCAIEK
jgi:glycosyltransferase involved in cell wall biosynthesis